MSVLYNSRLVRPPESVLEVLQRRPSNVEVAIVMVLVMTAEVQ